jgi:hypothetical protein
MTGTWKDFTGIKLLAAGIENFAGMTLLKNELGNVSDGYHISHAGTPESGYTFGGNQMDLANKPESIPLFKDILVHAATGGLAFYNFIAADITVKGNANLLTASEKATINMALSSSYGKEAINSSFKTEVQAALILPID